MKRTVEVTLFAGIAALFHVSLFASAPESGVQSSGSGGEARISIEATNETVAEMVESWDRPPPRPEMVKPDLELPLASIDAPQMPEFELADAPGAAVLVALTEPEDVDEVEVDQSTPPPPPPPEPEPEPEPKPEPKPRRKPAPKPAQTPPTAEVADQAVAARAAQQAAGAGGGSQAGVSRGSATSTVSAGRRAKLLSIWGSKVRSRIERRKRYPSGERGSGKVTLRITVAANGTLINTRIAKSSGVAAFDQAALQAVRRARKFPPAPKGLGKTQYPLNLVLRFSK